MRRFLAFFVAAALLALTASACSSTLSDAATIRYSLSGTDHEDHVSRADLMSEVTKIVKNKPFADFLKQQGFPVNGDVSAGSAVTSIWLSQLIQQKAIDALFASRHLEVTPTLREQATQNMVQLFPAQGIFSAFDGKYREELIDREARREAVYNSFFDRSDAAGRRYFDAHKAQFACPSGKNLAHILVQSEAKAQEILGELRNGASFSELAQKDSTDTGSAPAGGSLGCLTPNTFVPAFQNAANAAPFDTPTGPVKTQYGYHVILVTHADPTYEDVRSQVQQALAQEAQTEAITARDKVLKAFRVHVDPRYGTWEAVNGQQGVSYQVTPPEAPQPNDSREGATTTTLPLEQVPNGAG
jgi:hypothetical protein